MVEILLIDNLISYLDIHLPRMYVLFFFHIESVKYMMHYMTHTAVKNAKLGCYSNVIDIQILSYFIFQQ